MSVYVRVIAGTHCTNTHRGMARLSLPVWLHGYAEMIFPARRQPVTRPGDPGPA